MLNARFIKNITSCLIWVHVLLCFSIFVRCDITEIIKNFERNPSMNLVMFINKYSMPSTASPRDISTELTTLINDVIQQTESTS